MSEASNRRRQQLLDKFLAGEVEKATYDALLEELNRLEGDAVSDSQPAPTHSQKGDEVRISATVHPTAGTASPAGIHAIVEPGVELNGFRIEKRIGRGGMGEVWQAVDIVGERHVVIKCLPYELSSHPQEMAAIKQMFHRVHDLQHQNICPLYLLGHDPRFGYFLVMKLIEGMTLDQYRAAYVKKAGAFTIKDVARVLIPIAKALDYAHQQKIVHRDVKPTNIMVSADGQTVQLVDFGLAAEIRGSLTRLSSKAGEVAGTYPYMAPEQWRAEPIDGLADQYALAVVAYELLAGRRPFDSPDPTILRLCALNDEPQAIAGVGKEIMSALTRGMAKQRADRFPNCVEFMKSLCQTVLAKTVAPVTPVAPATSRTADVSITETHVSRAPAAKTPIPSHPSKLGASSGQSAAQPAAPAVKPTRLPKPTVPDKEEIWVDEEDYADGDLFKLKPGSRKMAADFAKKQRQPQVGSSLDADDDSDHRQLFVMAGFGLGGMLVVALAIWGLFTFLGGGDNKQVADIGGNNRQQQNSPVNGTGTGTNGGVNSGAESGGGTQGSEAAGTNSGVANGNAKPATPAIRYRWMPGQAHTYAVTIDIEQDRDSVVQMSGNLTYTVNRKTVPLIKQPQVGTGTGFVVSADGYLLTCHHVTEGATKIEVALGKKSYPATLIADSPEHDLAIIKIEASGLPTVPLANSEHVKLGEDVRAIGYPLSSILGSNIKTTRGTISGINDDDEMGKVFQIDASINPGNSGGPLFNEQGQVIGVNFAKLVEVGEGVGFAVPINEAKPLLNEAGVKFSEKTGGAELKGADLISQVEPATALITVTSDGSNSATVSLRCDTKLNTKLIRKDGSIDPSFQFGRSRQAMFNLRSGQVPAEADIDDRGEVHEVRGDNSLPSFLGSIPQMIVERLPSRGEPTWGYSHPVTFSIVTNDDSIGNAPFGPFGGPPGFRGPRIRPPGFPGGFNAPTTEQFPGQLKVSYRRGKQEGPLLTIHKTFELKTRQTVGAGPRIELAGEGEFQLNTENGLPESYQFKGVLTENEEKTSTQTPIKVTYKRTSIFNGNAVVPVIPDGGGVPTYKTAGPQLKTTPVDLLALIDTKQHQITGEWIRTGHEVKPPKMKAAMLEIPFQATASYEIDMEVVCDSNKSESFCVGFPIHQNWCLVVLDGYDGTISGLSLVDGQNALQNPNHHLGRVLRTGKNRVKLRVSPTTVVVDVNGQIIIDWTGDAKTMCLEYFWHAGEGKPFIGAWEADLKVTRIEAKSL